jgi:hypothetical protein
MEKKNKVKDNELSENSFFKKRKRNTKKNDGFGDYAMQDG